MSGPAVSICVPTYNGEAFLGRTIASALAQTGVEVEVVVVDDASTDGTPGVVRGFSDPRLRYVRRDENRGVGPTWNEAVAIARAPLVKLLCHDDTLRPACVQRQAGLLARPGTSLVGCWRDVIDADDKKLLVRRGLRQGTAFGRRAVVRAMVRSGTNPVGEPSAVLFRKADWEAVGGFDAENLYMIDIDFWLKLLTRGTLAFVPEVLCGYRISPTALSTVLARKQVAAGRRFMRDLVADPANGLTRVDLWLGVTRATGRSWARQVLYATAGRA